MPEAQDQLVQRIAREVIAQLRARGLAEGAQGGHATAASVPRQTEPAVIQPPIGVCTGDYSQFPELRGRLHGKTESGPGATGSLLPVREASTGATGSLLPVQELAPTSGGAGERESSQPQPIPLTGFVTANQLQEALAAAGAGPVYLAPDARLTPLGNDLARQHPDRLRRLERAASASAAPGAEGATSAGPAALPWLWWIDGQCAAAGQVVREQGARLLPMVTAGRQGALVQVVRDLAERLQQKRIAGGLLFVRSAAQALCYANRCPSIRAVVGTCGEAVEEGIRELGANVLLIEYPHHGYRAQSAMVRRMMEQTPAAPPHVLRALADLHRCG